MLALFSSRTTTVCHLYGLQALVACGIVILCVCTVITLSKEATSSASTVLPALHTPDLSPLSAPLEPVLSLNKLPHNPVNAFDHDAPALL